MAHFATAGRHARRRSVLVSLLLTVAGLLVALAASTWRPAAQNQNGNSASRQSAVPAIARPATPGDRGATYHWLEGQATRVTTRFRDATTIAERVPGGDLRVRLQDGRGNEIASLVVDRKEALNDELDFKLTEDSARVSGRLNVPPTLDWANRQAYSLWKDRASLRDGRFEWQDTLMRPRGAARRDVEQDVVEVHTEWKDGLSAHASRESESRRHATTGVVFNGHSFTSRLMKEGSVIGGSRWYVEEGILSWNFPGLTEGYLDAARLQRIGGWPFVPDLAWANMQSIAFHYFHTLVANQGFVASNERNWLDQLSELVVPSLQADEAGCDGLHWLDSSIFRPCCDVHDWCYEAAGCSWSSWWQWWSSWQCDNCNMNAVYCFYSRGRDPYRRSMF